MHLTVGCIFVGLAGIPQAVSQQEIPAVGVDRPVNRCIIRVAQNVALRRRYLSSKFVQCRQLRTNNESVVLVPIVEREKLVGGVMLGDVVGSRRDRDERVSDKNIVQWENGLTMKWLLSALPKWF